MSEQVKSQIDQQRKKLEIDIIKDNHLNSINRDILYVCHSDLNRSTPTKDFKFEHFRDRIKTSQAAKRPRRTQLSNQLNRHRSEK